MQREQSHSAKLLLPSTRKNRPNLAITVRNRYNRSSAWNENATCQQKQSNGLKPTYQPNLTQRRDTQKIGHRENEQKEYYLAFPLPTRWLFERWNLSRHCKAPILRTLADEKALFWPLPTVGTESWKEVKGSAFTSGPPFGQLL